MNNSKWLIIVDYQKTFADREYKWSPRELYVDHGESLADNINDCIDKTKQEWWIILSSRELHSQWHMYFASSFKWKMPITVASTIDLSRWILTLKEVQNWTEQDNWLNATARFSVEELKALLAANDWEILLWPDHCVVDTRWADYFDLLNDWLIDHEVIKWRWVIEHPYSAFGWANDDWNSLIELIEWNNIQEVDVLGLALDYCVKDTVLDALKYKLKVNLILKWSAGVYPVWTYEAIKQMEKAWATIM